MDHMHKKFENKMAMEIASWNLGYWGFREVGLQGIFPKFMLRSWSFLALTP